MWDSTGDGHWGRGTVVDSYSMSYALETRREPLESSSLCVKRVQEVGKEWCSLLSQRRSLRSSRVRANTFPWSRVSKVNCKFQQDSPRMSLCRLEWVE